jgi:ComF family protein
MSGFWPSWLSSAGRALLQGVTQLVYPGHCLLCGQSLPPAGAHFCAACREALFVDPLPSCPRCAATVGPYAVLHGQCVNCRHEPYHFDQAMRLGPYDGPVKDAIVRTKRPEGEGLAELLGELWGERDGEKLSQLALDAVVPVPLHWWRRLCRGYNQSAAVARGLAQRLRLPCRPGWLRRVRYQRSQVGLSGPERRANVLGAFGARHRAHLAGRSVLLVDDVMTTGATASEAARALKEGGAARVVAAVVGRA